MAAQEPSERAFRRPVSSRPKPPPALLALIFGLPVALIVFVGVLIVKQRLGGDETNAEQQAKPAEKLSQPLWEKYQKLQRRYRTAFQTREEEPEGYARELDKIIDECEALVMKLQKIYDQDDNIKPEYQGQNLEKLTQEVSQFMINLTKQRDL